VKWLRTKALCEEHQGLVADGVASERDKELRAIAGIASRGSAAES
jgi:hypothetical protein